MCWVLDSGSWACFCFRDYLKKGSEFYCTRIRKFDAFELYHSKFFNSDSFGIFSLCFCEMLWKLLLLFRSFQLFFFLFFLLIGDI